MPLNRLKPPCRWDLECTDCIPQHDTVVWFRNTTLCKTNNYLEFLILEVKEQSNLLKSIAQSAGAVEYTDPPSQQVSWYDTKQSDSEVLAMLELWGMRNTPSLPSLPGPLWPGVVAPDRALSMG